MKTYKVSAVFYQYIEAENPQEAKMAFENSDPNEATLDSDSIQSEVSHD